MSKKQATFLGLPMKWDSKNIFSNVWNKKSDDIFPPKNFGIGWDINLHALLKAAGVIKPEAAGGKKAPIKKASKAKTKPQTGAKGSP